MSGSAGGLAVIVALVLLAVYGSGSNSRVTGHAHRGGSSKTAWDSDQTQAALTHEYGHKRVGDALGYRTGPVRVNGDGSGSVWVNLNRRAPRSHWIAIGLAGGCAEGTYAHSGRDLQGVNRQLRGLSRKQRQQVHGEGAELADFLVGLHSKGIRRDVNRHMKKLRRQGKVR